MNEILSFTLDNVAMYIPSLSLRANIYYQRFILCIYKYIRIVIGHSRPFLLSSFAIATDTRPSSARRGTWPCSRRRVHQVGQFPEYVRLGRRDLWSAATSVTRLRRRGAKRPKRTTERTGELANGRRSERTRRGGRRERRIQ